jgi:putative metalloprotease
MNDPQGTNPPEHQWSDRNPESSPKELITLVGMFLCLLVFLIWALNLVVGWLIVQMPVSWERNLGQAIVKVYETQAKSGTEQAQLDLLVNKLEAIIPAESKAKRDYQVLYIPQDIVNAAAIPGDTILIFQGLLAQMESENELMMVLGHELGHFAHRDHLRGIGRSLVIRTVVSSLFGDVTFLADAAQMVSNAKYSQSQEEEADKYGLELLYQTYGQAVGATDFFARMAEKQSLNWDFLASHPAPAKRVKKLDELIKAKNYAIGTYTPLPEALQTSVENKPSP